MRQNTAVWQRRHFSSCLNIQWIFLYRQNELEGMCRLNTQRHWLHRVTQLSWHCMTYDAIMIVYTKIVYDYVTRITHLIILTPQWMRTVCTKPIFLIRMKYRLNLGVICYFYFYIFFMPIIYFLFYFVMSYFILKNFKNLLSKLTPPKLEKKTGKQVVAAFLY